MAVTVITKKRGSPLVTGEVGVSIINWKDKYRGGDAEMSAKWKCRGRNKSTQKQLGKSGCVALADDTHTH